MIAGGSAAGLVQASTVLARGASTLTTGGLGNPLFATAELAGSIVTSVLSLVAPLGTILLIIVIALVLSRKLFRLKHRPQAVQHVDSRA